MSAPPPVRPPSRRLVPPQLPPKPSQPPQTGYPVMPPMQIPTNSAQAPIQYTSGRTNGRETRRKTNRTTWIIVIGGVFAAMMLIMVLLVGVGALFLFGGNAALRGVRVGGVNVGGMTIAEAAAALSNWQITLVDTDSDGAPAREVRVFAADIGIGLDIDATARAAVEYGRRSGGIGAAIRAAFGSVNVPPVVDVNPAIVGGALDGLASTLNTSAMNAGIQVVNGQIAPRQAVIGRALDAAGTAAGVNAESLADGELELVMVDIPPAITDPAPVLAAAQSLIVNPLTLQLYDPILDQSVTQTIPTETWSTWLIAEDDPTSATGVRLRLDTDAARNGLTLQPVGAGKFGAERFFAAENVINQLNAALEAGTNVATARLYYRPIQHTVSSGESITSIAWDYGIPYPYIQEANPGVSELSIGQTITIPSLDTQIPLPVIPNKRIIVSISGQNVKVYENGSLKWDWIASTGIASSPTWNGVYQILSHEPNAYAGNWNLWMPNFLGVYHPIPNAEFINGFHGFPTRNGGQLLWTNNLGTRVTYGCILLSDANIALLYDWAEEGVVVEIQP